VCHRHRRPFGRLRLAAGAVAAIVALAAGWGAAGARADGDPASDVLVTQTLFVPLELSITRETETLGALLAQARDEGFPVRVALIAAPDDLGTVTPLWRNPVGYSRYLGTELSLAFPGQVVVVMPDGIGVWPGTVAPTAAERLVAARLPAPGSRAALVAAAIDAVERLAAAHGHPLAAGDLHVSAPAAVAGGGHALEWIVFASGALLIAVCWAFSLHARPLGRRRETVA
jgi:hypothetical protein